MNLTEIDESYNNGNGVNHLYSYFDVDSLNRVTARRDKKYLAGSGKFAWPHDDAEAAVLMFARGFGKATQDKGRQYVSCMAACAW